MPGSRSFGPTAGPLDAHPGWSISEIESGQFRRSGPAWWTVRLARRFTVLTQDGFHDGEGRSQTPHVGYSPCHARFTLAVADSSNTNAPPRPLLGGGSVERRGGRPPRLLRPTMSNQPRCVIRSGARTLGVRWCPAREEASPNRQSWSRLNRQGRSARVSSLPVSGRASDSSAPPGALTLCRHPARTGG
jgi:hypothetical protein